MKDQLGQSIFCSLVKLCCLGLRELARIETKRSWNPPSIKSRSFLSFLSDKRLRYREEERKKGERESAYLKHICSVMVRISLIFFSFVCQNEEKHRV